MRRQVVDPGDHLAAVDRRDSSQHSLLTCLTWLAANATMATWLYERNERHINKAVVVNTCNATMCLVVSGLIVADRFA